VVLWGQRELWPGDCWRKIAVTLQTPADGHLIPLWISAFHDAMKWPGYNSYPANPLKLYSTFSVHLPWMRVNSKTVP
jgi:hypothetical protein